MTKAKKSKVNKKVSVGVAITGVAAAAAAAAYYFYGPKGKQYRVKIRGWALKAKGELLENVEKIKSVDKKAYNALVDKITVKYKKLKGVSSQDVAKLSKELKAQWVHIERNFVHKAVAGKKIIKKAVHKVAKKVARKTAKKSPKKKTTRRSK